MCDPEGFGYSHAVAALPPGRTVVPNDVGQNVKDDLLDGLHDSHERQKGLNDPPRECTHPRCAE